MKTRSPENSECGVEVGEVGDDVDVDVDDDDDDDDEVSEGFVDDGNAAAAADDENGCVDEEDKGKVAAALLRLFPLFSDSRM